MCESWIMESDVQCQQVCNFYHNKSYCRHKLNSVTIRINGVPACANKKLLTDILRNEWGFKGKIKKIV